MPGIINTGSHPKLLWPGIHAIWGQVYNEHEKEYDKLYNWETSGKAYEEDVEVTGFGLAPIKAEGAPISYDSEIQGIISRYQHIAYAQGYIVTYEELRDDLYEQVSMRRAKANAFAMAQTVENIAAFPYNNAFSTTYFQAGDGQALCSTSNVQATGGTWANTPVTPADLAESSLEDAIIQIMGTTTDRGLLVNIKPESLHIARQEWFNANRILKSVLQSNTANNNINVLQATNALPGGIHVNHYFTAPHAWFLRTDCPNGMTAFWRDQPEFAQDNDFDTKNAKASAYMRLSVGVTDKRGIFGVNGP
jgi:hypothetical protein